MGHGAGPSDEDYQHPDASGHVQGEFSKSLYSKVYFICSTLCKAFLAIIGVRIETDLMESPLVLSCIYIWAFFNIKEFCQLLLTKRMRGGVSLSHMRAV